MTYLSVTLGFESSTEDVTFPTALASGERGIGASMPLHTAIVQHALAACGVSADVIAPPTDAEGGLFSETNDNSVAILLTYATARVLLAGDAEAREEHMTSGPYTGS